MNNFQFLGIDEDNQLVFLSSMNPNGGASGVIMDATLTQDQVDEHNSLDYVMGEYDYLWREAVANQDTEESLEDYCQGLIDQVEWDEGLFVGDDPSYRYETEGIIESLDEETREKVEAIVGVKDEDYVALTCSACGYIFHDQRSIDVSNWKLIVNPKLIDEIKKSIAGGQH